MNAKKVVASQPIGDTGLHHVVYSSGEAAVHDNNDNPVHPLQVADVLGHIGASLGDGGASISHPSDYMRRQPGAFSNGIQLAKVDTSLGGLHSGSYSSVRNGGHGRLPHNSAAHAVAKPNTANWFIKKAPSVPNPRNIAPAGTTWFKRKDDQYLVGMFPDHSIAMKSPEGLWMTPDEWADRTGRTRPSSDPLPDNMVTPGDWRAGTGGPTINRQDQLIHPPNKLAPSTPNRVSPNQLGVEWALGKTPAHSHPFTPGSPVPDVTFHSGDPMTEQLRKDDGIQSTLKGISTGLKNGSVKLGTDHSLTVSLRGAGASRVAHDAENILTNGRTGNLTSTFLGTYGLNYKVVSVDPKKRIALVRMHVNNTTDRESATRFPKWGYAKHRNTIQDSFEHPFRPVRNQPPTGVLNNSTKGLGKNMRQDFEWYERVPY
jgi:hypothetical protein